MIKDRLCLVRHSKQHQTNWSMGMSEFYVIGGEYKTTEFKQLTTNASAVCEGPFDSYEAAVKCWQSHAWASVDNALAHFHIEERQAGLPDNVDETQFWVIGGSFDTLDFDNWSDATDIFGPYLTYQEAEKKWQQLAWSTVDDATARYRIETLRPETKTLAKRKIYRCLTGPDNDEFCERVSKALADGYVLHGSPSLTTKPDGTVIVAQAVILAQKQPAGD